MTDEEKALKREKDRLRKQKRREIEEACPILIAFRREMDRERSRRRHRERMTEAELNASREKDRLLKRLQNGYGTDEAQFSTVLTSYREKSREATRRRRERMTEAEVNAALEKKRIAFKLRRALMSEKEIAQSRRRDREKHRERLWKQKLNPLNEELEIIKWQLDTLQRQGENFDLEEQSHLDRKRTELELKIKNTLDVLQVRNRTMEDAYNNFNGDSTSYDSNQQDSLAVSPEESCSDPDMDTEDLARLTLNKVGDGVTPDVCISDEDDGDEDQKMRSNETMQEWVQRLSNPSNKPAESSSLSEGKESHTIGIDGLDNASKSAETRKGRLIVMRAKATLFKLQKVPLGETTKSKQDRIRQLDAQKKVILQLITKYPEEFNNIKPRTTASQRRQRKNQIAAITKNNIRNNQEIATASQAQGFRTLLDIRFRRPPSETEEQRLQRIAEKIKFKGAKLDNETPEELAARIVREVEVAKKNYKPQKQIASSSGSSNKTLRKPASRERNLDIRMESLLIRKILETPERRAERLSRMAANARLRNKMERSEYNIFMILNFSDDPMKSLEDAPWVPETLSHWYNYSMQDKMHVVPDYLAEWRIKTYMLLNWGDRLSESLADKQLRRAKMNDDLKKWLKIHGNGLKEYLTKRKNKLNEYMKNRAYTNKTITEEEKEAKRIKMNERFRQRYLKAKLAQGISVTPKGARPHANKFYKSTEEKLKEPLTRSRIRNTKSKKAKPSSGVMSENDTGSTPLSVSSQPLPTPVSSAAPSQKSPSLINDKTVIPKQSCPAVSTGNNPSIEWPTLGLVNSSANEDRSHHQVDDLDEGNGDEDWLPLPSPVSNYVEPSHCTVDHNHVPGDTYAENQFTGGLNSQMDQNTMHAAHDDSFLQLLHAPCQNNLSNVMPQVPVYPPARIEERPDPFTGAGSFSLQQLHQYQYHPTQLSNAPYLAHPIDVAFNCPVPIIHPQDLQAQVLPKPMTEMSSTATATITATNNVDGCSRIDALSSEDTSSTLPNNKKEECHLKTKGKRKRRPRGPDRSKRSRRKKITEKVFPPEAVESGSVDVNTAPQNIKEGCLPLSNPEAKRKRRPRGPDRKKRTRRKTFPDRVFPPGAVLVSTTPVPVVVKSTVENTEKKIPNINVQHKKMVSKNRGTQVCKVCNMQFEKEAHLVQHLWKSHKNNEDCRCPACPKKFISMPKLILHLQNHPSERKSFILGMVSPKHLHEGAEKFYCNVCTSVFDSYLKVVIHRDTHKYICTTCGIILKDADHILEHTFRRHPEVDWRCRVEELNKPTAVEDIGNIFICSTCDSEFLTQKFLFLHEADGHTKIKPSRNSCLICEKVKNTFVQCFHCFWCSEVFDEESIRLKHMLKNHLENKTIPRQFPGVCGNSKYKCELCRRSYYSLLQLRRHFEASHISKTSRERNTIHFNEKTKLTATNSSTETPSKNTDIPEVEVNAVENGEQSEPQHGSKVVPPINTSLVVFPCNICYSNYQTEEFLQKHLAAAHVDSSKHYRFPCELCKITFSSANVLLRHKKNIHSTASKHQCPHCPAKLGRRNYLLLHIKSIHENPKPLKNHKPLTNYKPFRCELCTSNFKTKKNLEEHTKKVHAGGSLFCEICGKQITAATPEISLQRHMTKLHPEHAPIIVVRKPGPARPLFGKLPCKKLHIPELLILVEEISRSGVHVQKMSNSGSVKKRQYNKNCKKKKKYVESETENEDDEINEDSIAEDLYSDQDCISGNSSSDEDYTSSKKQIRRTFQKTTVIEPKTRKRRVMLKLQKLDDDIMEMIKKKTIKIVLERCDKLVKVTALKQTTESNVSDSKTDSEEDSTFFTQIPNDNFRRSGRIHDHDSRKDYNFKRSTRSSNLTKRYILYSDVSE